MTPDALDAILAVLPDDAPVTLPAGDLRSVMHDLRSETDAYIHEWMSGIDGQTP